MGRRAELAVLAAVVVLLDPGDGGVVERLQGERLDPFEHGHQAALNRGPQNLHLAVLIRRVGERGHMNDAEPVQPVGDLAGRHRRAVVAHQRARQAALHEGLAEPVDEDLGGLREVPLQVAAEARVVVEEAEQDRRLPFAGRRRHAALGVVHIAVPEAVAARHLVAEHLAGLRGRHGLGLEAPPAALAHQPAIAHRPGQRRVGGHRAERRIGLDQHPQVLVVQLRRPRRMRPVLVAQRLDQRRRHRPHPPGIGARPAPQRLDRVLVCRPRLVVPALDRRDREPHRPLAGRVIPVPLRQPLKLGPQLSRRRRRGQKRPDHREAQPRPPVAVAPSVVAVHPGIPPWPFRGDADVERPIRS